MATRVLLFEDNKNYRQSLAAALASSSDIEVVGEFGDCRFLREQVEAHRPDLVFLDIDMPHVDGLQGLFILKSHFSATKALMLTIFDESEKVFQAVCLGADGYLLKHTPPQKIIDAVADAMAGGSPMTPSIARKVLTVFQKSGFQPPVEHDLTASELEVLRLLVAGLSYKMVAAERGVTINTIRSQIKSVYEKLRVHSVSEAVAKAIREQIV